MYRSLLASFVVPLFTLAVANPAIAAEKAKEHKATISQKVLHDDDRVRVTETTSKPGNVGNNTVRGKRVTRYIQGGTQERNYADGRKEKIERKTGEVFVAGPDKDQYFVRNIGKTTIVTYTVTLKEPKKK
ncbi:MAG: hypothetical protein ACRET6_04210 [Burkholderiales bacterium]